MNIWSPFTRCHVNAEHKIRYNEIFLRKKKSIQYVMCKEIYVHQNCLITNIIQQIFCLPQAKKCIQCWNFFEWTFPLSANPTPQMISLVESIRQSPVEKSSVLLTRPMKSVGQSLCWTGLRKKLLKYYSCLQYLIMMEMGNQACCIVGYSILCSSVEYFTFCLEITCKKNICILCTVYKVYCIL